MGSIEIQDENLVIESLEIDDKEIVNYFKKIEEVDMEEHFLIALKLGIASLEFSSTKKDVLIIESAFNEMKDKFNNTLDEFLGEDGVLCQYFDENDKQSFISKIQETICSELDVNNETSAFSELKKILTTELVTIGRNLAVKEGEKKERKRGHLKGKDFEDQVYLVLDDIAEKIGDTVDKTGDTIGKIPGSKKGDLLITINPKYTGNLDKKIVLEVKDEPRSIEGKKGVLPELDEAIENRDAEFGIFVWSEEAEEKSSKTAVEQVGPFRFYPPTRIVCAIDKDAEEPDWLPLELAYRFARAEVFSQLRGEEAKIDINIVKNIIYKAKNRIKQASNLKRSVSGIETSLVKLKTEITALRTESLAILDELEELITG
ncbi:MAG: hypothetical protein ACTSQI_21330 [Candidatus Helarchaeota archaeon]